MITKQISITEVNHYRHLKRPLDVGAWVTLKNGDDALILEVLDQQHTEFKVELPDPQE